MKAPPTGNLSLSSSIYTISGAQTVNPPTPLGGPLGLTPSSLGSYVIPPFDSRSPLTTDSINETSMSVEESWRPAKQPPIGTRIPHKSTTTEQISTADTATPAEQAKVTSSAVEGGRRLWSEVLAHGLKSKTENAPSEATTSVQRTTAAPPVASVPSVNSRDSIRTVITVRNGTERTERTGQSRVNGGPIRSSPISNIPPSTGPKLNNLARNGQPFTYSAVVANGKESKTAIASSPILDTVGIQTSSSQESAASLKRRRKFDQIPLRTEPPKSRKELRKERQARERAEKK